LNSAEERERGGGGGEKERKGERAIFDLEPAAAKICVVIPCSRFLADISKLIEKHFRAMPSVNDFRLYNVDIILTRKFLSSLGDT